VVARGDRDADGHCLDGVDLAQVAQPGLRAPHPVVIFLLFQRAFIRGIALSGLKD
jgi:hypothetical protein